MAEEHKNGFITLRWVHVVTMLFVQVLMLGAVWGSLRYQVEEHERRIGEIEKHELDEFMPRKEFESRHQDLQRRVEELREQIQQLQTEGRKKN